MRLVWVVPGTLAACALGPVLYLRSQPMPEVKLTMVSTGLSSLKSNGVEHLSSGEFHVNSVLLRRASGETYPGDTTGSGEVDEAAHRWTGTYPWGKIQVTYTTDRNRFNLAIDTQNTSPTETIQGVWYTPVTLKFPRKLAEYDGSIPLIVDNIDSPGVLRVSYDSGSLLVASENAQKPLQVGFPWSADRPASLVYPLTVNTDRVKSLPDSYPTIDRPIPPNGSDEYRISLRFGRTGDDGMDLATDILDRYSKDFPSKLNWTDRRPIGAIFLASAATEWPKNPRGWLMDQNLDVTTPAGRTILRNHILELANRSIGILKDMNAQGAITWDIEGQEFAHAISYIGDPRMAATLAPEMSGILDDYFKTFRNAGFRVGVCVRPQHLEFAAKENKPHQAPSADPAHELISKIRYAKEHWGVSLIYIDSNVNPTDSNPLSAEVIEKVASEFPDVLLIPEHSTPRYYAYTAPYKELRQGYTSTDNVIRAIYPKAFTLINTADGPLDMSRKPLMAAVKHGDSVIYRTWYPDPQNVKVRALYQK